MIEKIIKKLLRKWLKKELYTVADKLSLNKERFDRVFDAPLRQWRDRIWVVQNNPYSSAEYCSRVYNEYLINKVIYFRKKYEEEGGAR